MDAERLRHAGAELVGLHEHRDERHDVVDAGAVPEVSQRVDARAAGAQLEVDHAHFICQIGVREIELFADALYRLVETEAGLHAHDEQVERV